MKRVIVDIETDNLLADVSKVWCIVLMDADTGKHYTYTHEDSLLPALEQLAAADEVIGHNIINYDLPVLKKIFSLDIPLRKVKDTFILSQMLYANEMVRHGLDEWGQRFKFPKGKFEDWNNPGKEMYEYCLQDVKITYKLWCFMKNEFKAHDWSLPLQLEQKVIDIYTKHQTHWYLDMELLPKAIQEIGDYAEEQKSKVMQYTKPQLVSTQKVTRSVTLKGDLSSAAKKYAEDCNINIVGDFCKVKFDPFNLSSSTQVVEWLLGMGWRPEKFSDKTGKPSISGDPFYGIPKSISEPLLEYKKAMHKLGSIKGWAEKAGPNGEIEQFAFTCGTNTARFRHGIIVNVPQASEHPVFGKIMRELFIAKEGYKLIGVDASALEARIEGHYTQPYDGGLYGDMLLNGDIHQLNADSWGIDRNDSKAPYFAMTYGAQPKKIASMLNVSEQQARHIFAKYWEDRPAVVSLLQALHQSLASRGQGIFQGKMFKLKSHTRPWIKGIDGRKLYVRSSHSIKNTLIQSAGSIAMKVGYCYIADQIEKQGLDARIVMFYHDEVNVMVKDDKEQINSLTKILEDAIIYAGKYFKLNVPLEGEAKTGNSWHEIH